MKFVDTVLQLSCVFSVLVWYVSVQARVYCTPKLTCAFSSLYTRSSFSTLNCVVYTPIPLPAQSIIHMMYFTRCFHYQRNPYPQN